MSTSNWILAAQICWLASVRKELPKGWYPDGHARVRTAWSSTPDAGRRAQPVMRRVCQAGACQGVQPIFAWQFPRWLKECPQSPWLVFVRGAASLVHEAENALAVVGSRRASADGIAWAHRVAHDWAARGGLIVSGGAIGIDAAAHRGALSVTGGRTLAWIGSAIDELYPVAHRELFRRIISAGGALVSEIGPGEPSRPFHHAARNRFVAAQGSRLLVVEAAARSGTLGTAAYARRLGRPVLIAPTEVRGEKGGFSALIAAGAQSWTSQSAWPPLRGDGFPPPVGARF